MRAWVAIGNTWSTVESVAIWENTRQGPRLTLKKVRRENEVPKKWDFNFDY